MSTNVNATPDGMADQSQKSNVVSSASNYDLLLILTISVCFGIMAASVIPYIIVFCAGTLWGRYGALRIINTIIYTLTMAKSVSTFGRSRNQESKQAQNQSTPPVGVSTPSMNSIEYKGTDDRALQPYDQRNNGLSSNDYGAHSRRRFYPQNSSSSSQSSSRNDFNFKSDSCNGMNGGGTTGNHNDDDIQHLDISGRSRRVRPTRPTEPYNFVLSIAEMVAEGLQNRRTQYQ